MVLVPALPVKEACLTLPLGVLALRAANADDVIRPGQYRANQITIALHNIGSLTLAAGLLVPGLLN